MHIVSEPQEITEFREVISPGDHSGFFVGGLDSIILGFQRCMIRGMSAGRAALLEGDFQDYKDIEAQAIAVALLSKPSKDRNNLEVSYQRIKLEELNSLNAGPKPPSVRFDVSSLLEFKTIKKE